MSENRINVTALAEQLLGPYAEVRKASRARAARPELQRDPSLAMDAHRERVLGQLSLLVEEEAVQRAFPKKFGGYDDHGGSIASFEELVAADPSLQIKAGVQWGLFAGAILHLGTEEHHEKWLPEALNLQTPGAFAMTEIGHGSDVAAVATTATYDEETDEFIIHTPFKAAWKEFLGNAALHGKAATVFAQLITKGVNHGVHCFYVPIRDEQGNFYEGIGGEDDGLKGGLNGIDNGRLHFTNVRVPRTNLLNRYGNVDENGEYSSPIASSGRRFFTMLGTLVQGRVSLDGAATSASKIGLQIAVTYGNQRRQFNSTSDIEETTLLDYQRHQRRLITRIARTYASSFAHDGLLDKFDAVFSGRADSDDDRQDLETLAAALKPLSTWDALDTLQETREACGGSGFIAKNRFTQLYQDLDVYVTFEGDNNVLLQLVGKRLLTDYASEFRKLDNGAMALFAAKQVGNTALNRSGLRGVGQAFADISDERKSANFFKDVENQRALLTGRIKAKVAEVANALRSAGKDKAKGAAAFNENQDLLISAARDHGQLLRWEAFTAALEKIDDPTTHEVLTWLRDVFTLSLIEEDLGWYLGNGFLSMQRARTLPGYINRLLARLRPHAQDLVDAFGYTQDHLRADISSGGESERQDEAMAYFRTLRASDNAPISEKSLKKSSV
ncbi:acyl-CoA dehydrogenase [Glutamicibacter sp. JC586]|uniref:acyl-CoA dehydrogenase family protein n=1 Tax=Glutamicibacter sp. JC586 TaxID=2590552 RepID=UPI00135B2705|nr:acyl-CoA dehydrogenase [Glutamicibacter sp. JC586]